MSKYLKALPDKSDSLLLMGVVSLFYGIYQFDPPTAYIILGITLIAIGVIAAKPTDKKVDSE